MPLCGSGCWQASTLSTALEHPARQVQGRRWMVRTADRRALGSVLRCRRLRPLVRHTGVSAACGAFAMAAACHGLPQAVQPGEWGASRHSAWQRIIAHFQAGWRHLFARRLAGLPAQACRCTCRCSASARCAASCGGGVGVPSGAARRMVDLVHSGLTVSVSRDSDSLVVERQIEEHSATTGESVMRSNAACFAVSLLPHIHLNLDMLFRRQWRGWRRWIAATRARRRWACCPARATWTLTCALWQPLLRWPSVRRLPWCCRAAHPRRVARLRGWVRLLAHEHMRFLFRLLGQDASGASCLHQCPACLPGM